LPDILAFRWLPATSRHTSHVDAHSPLSRRRFLIFLAIAAAAAAACHAAIDASRFLSAPQRCRFIDVIFFHSFSPPIVTLLPLPALRHAEQTPEFSRAMPRCAKTPCQSAPFAAALLKRSSVKTPDAQNITRKKTRAALLMPLASPLRDAHAPRRRDKRSQRAGYEEIDARGVPR
jgi:hypothetical protein